MTALLYDNPRFVHLHIPKTGGTSIRAVMDAGRAQRAFGHIPTAWQGAPVLAVVREPVARFLSAVNMFRLGTPDVEKVYATPTLPDLTIRQALDILNDEGLAADRSARSPEANLRHHLIAQTHPINTLHLATYCIRLERLAEDWPKIAAQLGLNPVLENLRTTQKLPGALTRASLTASELAEIQAAFSNDFTSLGYQLDGGFTTAEVPRVAPPESPGIWGAWPAYFSNLFQVGENMDAALPDPDVPLDQFAKNIVPHPKGSTWVGRDRNLVDHFHKLQPEFAGRSRMAHLLACSIVVLRREPQSVAAHRLFFRMIDTYREDLAAEVNSRWLAAICDTLADHGQSAECRNLALAGCLLINTVKLAETERRLYTAPLATPPKRRLRYGGALFDGVVGFSVPKGDLIENMIDRAEKLLDPQNPASAFVAAILFRLFSLNTVYRRFSEMAGQPVAPVATIHEQADLRAAIAKIDSLKD